MSLTKAQGMKRSIEHTNNYAYSKNEITFDTQWKNAPPDESQPSMLSVDRTPVVEAVTKKHSNKNCQNEEIHSSNVLTNKRKKTEHESSIESVDNSYEERRKLQLIQDMTSLQINNTTKMENNWLSRLSKNKKSDVIQDQQINAYEVQQKSLSISLPLCKGKPEDKSQSCSSPSYRRNSTPEKQIQMELPSDSHHMRNDKQSEERHHEKTPASQFKENPEAAMLLEHLQPPTSRVGAQTSLPSMPFNIQEGIFDSSFSNYWRQQLSSPLSLGFSSSNILLGHSRGNGFDQLPSFMSLPSSIRKDLVLRAMMDQTSHALLLLDIESSLQDTAYSEYLSSQQVAQQVLLQELLATQSTSRLLFPFMSSLRPAHTTIWLDTLQSLQTGTNTSQGRGEVRSSSYGIASECNFDSEGTLHSLLHQPSHDIDDRYVTGCRYHEAKGSESVESISAHPFTSQNHLSVISGENVIPESLPIALSLPEDTKKLSPLQVLLRQQIEIFAASEDDLMTHARGRNKPITLKQVGIRCRHCASLPLKRQKRGAVYFPFTLLGIYQAAQNMASSHFIQDNCSEISSEIRLKLLEFNLGSKSAVGLGKYYWANLARTQGLFDTDHGIRFIRDQ
jgi:hypothetical protein